MSEQPKHEMLVMVRGPYAETVDHHDDLKEMRFRFNPSHKAWFGPDMTDAEITRLSRQIGSCDVEVRRVRKDFVENYS